MQTNTASQSKPAAASAHGVGHLVVNVLLNPFVAVALFVLLIAGVQHLDIEDRQAEWTAADSIKQAQRDDASAQRAQRVAQSMCEADYGPNSMAVWISSFTVECVNNHGKKLARFSPEVQNVQR